MQQASSAEYQDKYECGVSKCVYIYIYVCWMYNMYIYIYYTYICTSKHIINSIQMLDCQIAIDSIQYPSMSKNRCQQTSLIPGHPSTTTTGMAAGSRGNNGQSASTSTCANLMSWLGASFPVGNPERAWQIGKCEKAPKKAIQQKNTCALLHVKG